MGTIQISKTYFAMAKAALAKGIRNSSSAFDEREKPKTVIFEIDKQWIVELNGHDDCVNDIPGLSARIFFENKIVGFVGPFERYFVDYENVSEYRFVRACEKCYKSGELYEQIELDLEHEKHEKD